MTYEQKAEEIVRRFFGLEDYQTIPLRFEELVVEIIEALKDCGSPALETATKEEE